MQHGHTRSTSPTGKEAGLASYLQGLWLVNGSQFPRGMRSSLSLCHQSSTNSKMTTEPTIVQDPGLQAAPWDQSLGSMVGADLETDKCPSGDFQFLSH